ncbi:diguanylate cyclase (GGDEF)-like protein [Loktanella sp. PT4BL]|jgi:diguanylate cyclase (GGDEF)-like protein|uniref:GGDEF domain-containing protein n=1 Tax=Loktanella sp. PT4BL TaxID=2135611 RepID=UPI000D976F18|nr:GGDEF domain-containing protein [Loktanella sp. PT4BL]PXW68552.1 diguanylate cyclase (GGDEF)-like protein [Loktanella sp. PT4BL]
MNLMDQIMRLLAPQSTLGFIVRLGVWLGFVTVANIAFATFFGGGAYYSLWFYLAHSIVVGGPIITFFFIITMFQLRLQRKLWHLSRMDGLTGLNNRNTFFDLAAKARTRENTGVLMMLDADRFKAINDTYGHQAGDKCLQAIAAKLRENIRQDDVLGRLGGEEFAIYLRDAAPETAQSIGTRLTQPIKVMTEAHGELTVTLSIGAVMAQPAIPIDTLLGRADAALYYAKQNGRALFVNWTPSLQKKALRAHA